MQKGLNDFGFFLPKERWRDDLAQLVSVYSVGYPPIGWRAVLRVPPAVYSSFIPPEGFSEMPYPDCGMPSDVSWFFGPRDALPDGWLPEADDPIVVESPTGKGGQGVDLDLDVDGDRLLIHARTASAGFQLRAVFDEITQGGYRASYRDEPDRLIIEIPLTRKEGGK